MFCMQWLFSFPRFEFVKSSGSSIVPIQVTRGQERNARVIKHISGQGPVYIRAMEALIGEEVIALISCTFYKNFQDPERVVFNESA